MANTHVAALRAKGVKMMEKWNHLEAAFFEEARKKGGDAGLQESDLAELDVQKAKWAAKKMVLEEKIAEAVSFAESLLQEPSREE